MISISFLPAVLESSHCFAVVIFGLWFHFRSRGGSDTENLILLSLSSPSGRMHSSCTRRIVASKSMKVRLSGLVEMELQWHPKHIQDKERQVFNSKLSPLCPSVPVLCTCSPDTSYDRDSHWQRAPCFKEGISWERPHLPNYATIWRGLLNETQMNGSWENTMGSCSVCAELGSGGNYLN